MKDQRSGADYQFVLTIKSVFKNGKPIFDHCNGSGKVTHWGYFDEDDDRTCGQCGGTGRYIYDPPMPPVELVDFMTKAWNEYFEIKNGKKEYPDMGAGI